MSAEAVEHLAALGLSRNEALAYVALLEGDAPEGSTGYEVAARSGVPRSAIYAVMGKLLDVGAAFQVGDKPVRYLPTDPSRFLDQLRRRAETELARAGESLSRLTARPRPEPVWIVSAYADVLARAEELIRGARTSVAISAWGREVDALRPALDAAARRGGLHLVAYGPERYPPPPGVSCWFDDITSDAQKAAWSHKLLVVVDRAEALAGGSEPGVDNQAVVTANRSLVDVVTDHILLDITRVATASGRDCAGDVAPLMRPHLAR